MKMHSRIPKLAKKSPQKVSFREQPFSRFSGPPQTFFCIVLRIALKCCLSEINLSVVRNVRGQLSELFAVKQHLRERLLQFV